MVTMKVSRPNSYHFCPDCVSLEMTSMDHHIISSTASTGATNLKHVAIEFLIPNSTL